MHARHEEQDTEFRNVFAGAGVRSVVHFRPFHRSASTRKPVAETLVITGGVVEKHIASIFAKLGLPPSDSDNRRVIAAIKFLAG